MPLNHLSKDKKLAKLISNLEFPETSLKKNLHLVLCSSIISQQLSTKVAAVINKRFLDLFDEKTPKPATILEIPFDTLRSIGLSNNKVNYLQNVCRFFVEHKLTDKKLHAMSDDELIELLSQIKGIGRWSVEMILMFAMQRQDVFAVDDYGIQKAMSSIYKIDMSNKKEMRLKMIKISEKWKPYRTLACLYLWRSLDNK